MIFLQTQHITVHKALHLMLGGGYSWSKSGFQYNLNSIIIKVLSKQNNNNNLREAAKFLEAWPLSGGGVRALLLMKKNFLKLHLSYFQTKLEGGGG